MVKERCIIFIDHANIFHIIESIGVRIDYVKFKEVLSKDCYLVGAMIFVGVLKKVPKKKRNFFNFLESKGFAIVFNPVQQTRTGEYKQKGTDISIFANVVYLAKNYDKAILVSGDGDFVDLVEFLTRYKKKIEIWSFKKSLSHNLRDTAGFDNVHHIDDIWDEIEYKKNN